MTRLVRKHRLLFVCAGVAVVALAITATVVGLDRAGPAPAPAEAEPGGVALAARPTPTSTRSLGLPLVPWEGGPSYYEKFPHAKANGWTDPAFFPVAVWGATVENKRDTDVDSEIGLNTYVEIYGKPNLAAIRAAGMSAIHGHADAAVGNETVAWFLADEPEQFGQGPGEVLNYLKRQNAKFPKDNRMRYTNFTGNMVLPNYSPGDKVASSWLDLNDLFSLDIYWYARDLVCGGSVAGEIWKDGSGAKQPHGRGYRDLNEAECHRSSNYGYQVDEMRRLGALSGEMKPVWSFVENGSPFSPPDVTHFIKPEQMAGAVWNSLIHGARGVVYFNNTFTGDCVSSNNFRDPVYYKRPCYAAMRAKAKEVNLRIKELAPVLNTQSYAHTFDPKLDTMLKLHDGSYYIFAMPSGVKGGSATGQHTLTLPAGMPGSRVEVLFENRQLPIEGGRFTDGFAAEHTCHIYKITP